MSYFSLRNYILTILLLLSYLQVTAQLNGSYTINSNVITSANNYQSFLDFTTALSSQGVSGAITVNVVPNSGPYNERVIFNHYSGASNSNRVTIKGNGETISYTPTSSDYRIVGFDSAKYITLDSLFIEGNDPDYAFGIHLMKESEYIHIRNCTIHLKGLYSWFTNSRSSGIVSSSAANNMGTMVGRNPASNLIIEENYIYTDSSYMSSGIALLSNYTNVANNNVIRNNKIQNFRVYGINLQNQNNLLVKGNEISKPDNSTFTSTHGIYMREKIFGSNIAANKIYNIRMAPTRVAYEGIVIGINCSDVIGSSSSPTSIINNVLTDIKETNRIVGLNIHNSDYINIYHNTVMIDNDYIPVGLVGRNSHGLWMSGGSQFINIKNNIFSIREQYYATALKFENSLNNYTFTLDYNEYYVNSKAYQTRIASIGNNNFYTLNVWKMISSQDSNSLNVYPAFVSKINPTPLNTALNNSGVNVSILEDFYGNPRGVSTDIGAIEIGGLYPTNIPYYPIEIINKENSVGIADSLNVRCFTSGTVISYGLDNSLKSGYFISDNASSNQEGIFIESLDTNLNYTAFVGDSIKVGGYVNQVKGLSFMEIDSITLLDSNTFISNHLPISSPIELHEAQLVEFRDLILTSTYNSISHSFTADNGNNTILFNVPVFSNIRDSLLINNWSVGDTICRIKGIVSQNDLHAPYLSNYFIYPLYFSDITVSNCPLLVSNEELVSKESKLTLYPNPATNLVNINNDDIQMVEIIDINQKLVQKTFTSSIDVKHLKSGLYIVRVFKDKEIVNLKLIIN